MTGSVLIGLALLVGPLACLVWAWHCGMKLAAPTAEPLTSCVEPTLGRWEQPPAAPGAPTVAEMVAAMHRDAIGDLR